jgi:hypothetical protein
MEVDSDNATPSYQACICGRSFYQPGPFKKHQRSCPKSKKRLSSALEKAKEVWTSNKKQRILNIGQGAGSSSTGIDTVGTEVRRLLLARNDFILTKFVQNQSVDGNAEYDTVPANTSASVTVEVYSIYIPIIL